MRMVRKTLLTLCARVSGGTNVAGVGSLEDFLFWLSCESATVSYTHLTLPTICSV